MSEKANNVWSEHPELELVEKGAGLLASGVSSLSLGAIGWFWGSPETGVAIGLGIAGLSLGVSFSIDSGSRALYNARNGRNLRAYLRAVEATLEGAAASGIPASLMGFSNGGVEKAVLVGPLGAIAGGILSFTLLKTNLSQAFRERNQTPVAIA